MRSDRAAEAPAAPAATGGAEERQPELFSPRVIRLIASSVPLDVLVCTDRGVAEDAKPLFGEVHLLNPSEFSSRKELNGDRDASGAMLVLHRDPVAEALIRLGAELKGSRVLFAIEGEYGPALRGAVRMGSVLISDIAAADVDPAWIEDPTETELIDTGIGVVAGPPPLRGVIELALGRGFGADPEHPGSAADEGEHRLALRLAEQRVARLRDRNEQLEQRIGELRQQAARDRRYGPLSRGAHAVRRLRARLRPMLGVRLGLLWHHHPRELRIRESYGDVSAPRSAPSISIVVPSYNQGEFIGRTLDSVLDQDYPELELIVRDGGSSDETLAVLASYGERIADLESGPDGGQAAAINAGFRRSGGEIMAWLNSDDMLLPGSLAYVGRYFAEHPEVDVVYGHRVLIDTSDREIGRWVMPAHDDEVLSWADYVPQETLFWRRDVWERAGGTLNDELRFALDWDLLLRLRDAGATIVRLPRFLGAFRIHEEQKSSAQVGTLGRGEMDRLRRRVHGRRVSPEETAAATRSYLRRHLLLDKLQRLRLLRH